MDEELDALDTLFNEATAEALEKHRIGLAQKRELEALGKYAKLCRTCGLWKPLEEFYTRRDRRTADRFGKVSKCKACSITAYRSWYAENKEYVQKEGRTRNYMKRHAGRITQEEAEKLADNKKGNCDLCGQAADLFIDHCHTTGVRRGMLCQNCNFGLGLFHDSTELLSVAIEYLTKYREESK